ncbi:PTS transporter subunit EIIC [Streptococcus vestibularis]|uniref:N,N'-diacetylchitobiose permease IIC component n=1 Tax=Streptococcus vestibularis TaxID=1343 RepID=A0A564TV78_STRVE|nr:PTS transporter subunit EIIC [Streptococcus vestibularis]VUX11103.1 N,N'-diacetylchitobiose permease IIC component [Streptococcus vestibularis]
MTNYLVQRFLWFRERGFVQITQKTLASLFPFFLFSGIIRVISLSVFSELGYVNQLFLVSDWLPAFKITGQVLINLSNFLGGLAGPLSTYFAGKYTAGHYGRSTGTAGVTSLLVSLIIGSQELLLSPLNDGVLTRINLPASINIMLAIFVGYLVGQIFRFSRASDDQIVDKDYIYQPKTVRPIFLSLILAISLNILFVIGEQANVFQTIRQVTSTFTVTDNHLFLTFMMGLLNTFFAWIGNSQAFALNSIAEDSFALENLTYAVSHHTTTGLPHLYTLTNLYHSYGLVSGIGSGLALLVALLLASTSYKDKKVSLLSVFPILFNNGAPFMVGIPVLLNLVYLVPFLLAPMINMGIAAVALAIHLMPAAVYPVPDGTPSLLFAFIGTGGSLRALAISLLCFAVDILIFIPFVRLSNKVQHGLKEEGESLETK